MNSDDLRHHLTEAGIVPILMAGDSNPDASVAAADALVAAGATVIEVLFRSPQAPAVLSRIRQRHPALLLAAGTILDAEGAARAEGARADFMVSPGFSPALHAAAIASRLPLVPGVNTASEVQHARELGYVVQKFYPGWDHGHLRLPEFAVIYPEVRFLVTGGIEPGSLPAFARHRNVAAVGGTWMVGQDAGAFADDIARFRAGRGTDAG
jgi:2-dehydro-3-deoxyphosphogluconate aldolase/(4S)-4-hydroxy-2-oxoglutarate aldolase